MTRLGKTYLPILLLLISTNSNSAAVINQYLRQAQHASPYLHEPVSASSSWLDQPELRYSGSDEEEHGLAFRFRPRFESGRLAQNRIVDLLNQKHASLLDEQLNDELKLRYDRLIDLIETYNELDYLEHKLALNQQDLELNRSLAQTETFRIGELQAAEFDYHRTRQQVKQIGNRLKARLTGITGVSPVQLNEFLESWRRQVSDWDSFLGSGSKLLRLTNSKQLNEVVDRTDFQLAQQKLRLTRSDSASWLKFVELKLVDRPTGDQETTIGIAIPLGRDNIGIAQRAAEVNQENLSLQANRLKLSRAISDSVAESVWLRDQAALLGESEMLLKQQYSKLLKSGQAAIVLKLKFEILNYQADLRRLHIRGLRGYIELLHTAGYLAQQPLTNWLLRNQPKL